MDHEARTSAPAASARSAAPAPATPSGAAPHPLSTPPQGLLGLLMAGSAAGAAVLGTDLLVLEANDGFAALAGRPLTALLGRHASAVPFLGAPGTLGILRAVLADGAARPFTTGPTPSGAALRHKAPHVADAAASADAAAGTGLGGRADTAAAVTPEVLSDPPAGPPPEPPPVSGTCHRLVDGDRVTGVGIVLIAAPQATAPQAGAPEADAPPAAGSRTGSATGAGTGRVAASAVDIEPALVHARRRLALLDAATAEVGTTLDMDTTCAELARFAVPRLADLATVDVVPVAAPGAVLGGRPPSTGRLHRAGLACVPDLSKAVARLATPGELVRHRPDTAPALSLAERRPVPADLRPAAGAGADADGPVDAQSEACRRAGLGAVLAVPLIARDRAAGVLTLVRAASGPDFSAEDVELAQDLARRAAVAIDNARHYARSQGITLELQRALLAEPGNPHPNLDLASRYLPSGTSSVVGGDWFEAVRLSFGRTLLVIGDVMGHGVEAAVDMSDYRAMLRYVAGTDLPPHRILRQLDALISEKESARPATCLLALADPARNRCTYASAGHLPPALLSPGRATELVRIPTGPPLGTGLGGYEPAVGTLNADQVVLLYTDGLVERRNEDIDDSLARLAGLRLPVEADLDDLLDSVVHGLAPRAAEDDIAVLAARVRPR